MIATCGSDFDIILISGEPYADHPMSGTGVIARVLDAKGYRIGVVGRPDWKQDKDFCKLGRPRLFFGITSGAIDSLLVNYTPLKRERAIDPFVPYQSGIPDRAILVYSNKIRQLFPGATIVIGGVEASLRRFGHYDYWQNRVRRSLLLDSRADILVYGPGELQVIEIARRLEGLDGAEIENGQNPGGQDERQAEPRAAAGQDQVSTQNRYGTQDIDSADLAGLWRTGSAWTVLPEPASYGLRFLRVFKKSPPLRRFPRTRNSFARRSGFFPISRTWPRAMPTALSCSIECRTTGRAILTGSMGCPIPGEFRLSFLNWVWPAFRS